MEKIPVTIGILTYNSGKTLERCLLSVKDFRDIVIADGGSTDDTLAIAKRYGARIISQSQEGKPIDDFSLERNRLLDASQEDWFFYIDSDETVTSELVEAMRIAATGSFKVYRVRYVVTSGDFAVKYKTAVPYYQPRFFSTKIGARFIKKVHEKILWDKDTYPLGTINAPWYVPLDIQLDFKVYQSKVDHRLPLMIAEWKPSFIGALQKGIYEPIKTTLKILLKAAYLHLRFSSKDLIPLRYEAYRMYSQWVIMKTVWGRWIASHRR